MAGLRRKLERARAHSALVEAEIQRLRPLVARERRRRCRKCRKGQGCGKAHESAALAAALIEPNSATQEAARRLSSD